MLLRMRVDLHVEHLIKMGRVLLLLVCLAVCAGGEQSPWVRVGRADKDAEVRVTFAIAQTNVPWLKEKLRAVSYPDSPEYGQYLNFDEIAQVVHGRPESVQQLEASLESVAVGKERIDYTIGLDFAVVRMRVASAEELFSCEFSEFQHSKQNDWKVVSAPSYTVPSQLVGHIDFVSGISGLPRGSRVVPRPAGKLGVNPDTLDSSYNISGYTSTNPNNSQAIAGFLKQYFSPNDLKKFQEKYNIPDKPISKVVGTNDPGSPGIEANLDVQYIGATGRGVSTWFISISKLANKGQEDFLSWITAEVNRTDSPWVHSVSYGDYELSIPLDYQMRTENEFMKFGVSGRTIVVASGDEGVHCQKGRFIPEWPTCSPYVLSVGGTSTADECWNDGGGGFSDYYPSPDYQHEAVQAYLDSGEAPSTSYFNKSGRAYPDLSAFSTNYMIYYDGVDLPVSGTSCSTPTTAGIISILNDVRLNAGKPTLGFFNPLLYSLKGKGFHDITKGQNNGDVLFCKGFKAIVGWDPASGWGSPNFGLLKELVLQ